MTLNVRSDDNHHHDALSPSNENHNELNAHNNNSINGEENEEFETFGSTMSFLQAAALANTPEETDALLERRPFHIEEVEIRMRQERRLTELSRFFHIATYVAVLAKYIGTITLTLVSIKDIVAVIGFILLNTIVLVVLLLCVFLSYLYIKEDSLRYGVIEDIDTGISLCLIEEVFLMMFSLDGWATLNGELGKDVHWLARIPMIISLLLGGTSMLIGIALICYMVYYRFKLLSSRQHRDTDTNTRRQLRTLGQPRVQ